MKEYVYKVQKKSLNTNFREFWSFKDFQGHFQGPHFSDFEDKWPTRINKYLLGCRPASAWRAGRGDGIVYSNE